MTSKFLLFNRHAILYGIALALLLFLLKWLEYKYMVLTHAQDIYIGAIALVFTGLGIWLATKLAKPKVETVIIEKEVLVPGAPPGGFVLNQKAFDKLELSNREFEVLQWMAKGMSNQEIADQMFVSLNTIKTHSSNIFLKMDVKRRTQTVDKGRQLGIIP
ncbi:MAG: response regulator transcription factor [Taibaiella sp.]|nr:response regulator transcription factor [Taibaiella sp.]